MEIEKLEKEKIDKRVVFLGIANIVTYVLLSILPYFFDVKSVNNEYALLIISYILIFIASILFFKERLKRDIKYFKDNIKKYFSFIIKNQFLMFFIYIVISYISIYLLNSADSSLNQQEIENLPTYMIIITAILFSPVVEELVFRGSIRRFVKKDWLFIIISGAIFGFLHTLAEPTFIEIVVRGLPYVWIGIYFAYMYTKTENIMVPISCHFLHNTFAVIMLLIS